MVQVNQTFPMKYKLLPSSAIYALQVFTPLRMLYSVSLPLFRINYP